MSDTDNIIERAVANAAGPNYLARYGLTVDPFANEYNKDFFVVDDERSKRLNILLHLIQHSDLLLLVTGPRGIGKTSLLKHFLGMSTDLWRSCHIESHAMMHPDVLYRNICEAFEVNPADSLDATRDKLQQRLAELLHGDYVPILIIDDAHELPAETLREIIRLAELNIDDAGMLRIVLFSEPQIQEILDTPLLSDIRHRITHTLDLPPLTEEQTNQYVKQRLITAGLHGELPITKKQMQKLFKQSNGVPLTINRLAHELLSQEQPLNAVQKKVSTKKSTRPMKSIVMLLAIIGIAGIISAAIIHDVINRLWQNKEQQWVSKPAPSITLKTPAQKPEPQIKPRDVLPEKPAESVEQLPLVDLTPDVTGDQSRKSATTNLGKEVVGQIKDEDTATVLAEVPQNEPAVKTSEPVKQPEQTEVKPDPVLAPKPASTANPKPVTPVTQPKQTKPVVKKPTPASKQSPKRLTGTAWLKAQNPKHYTVQLNASRNVQSIKDYIKKHKLEGKVTYVRTTLTGKDWFILLYGSYPTQQLANRAAARLPLPLRKAKPWSRRLGDIKASGP